MRTSWDTDAAAEEIYSLLDSLIHNAERINAIFFLGGDFNASVGALEAGDDLTLVGPCWHGTHNRGARMTHWILEQWFHALNKLDSTMAIEECWTCKRALDGVLVQLDFLLANLRVRVVKAWVDLSLSIGPDHRCVHFLSRIGGVRCAQIKCCIKLKHWEMEHRQAFIQQSQVHSQNYKLFRQKDGHKVWLLQAGTMDVMDFNTCGLFLPDCW